MNSCEIACKCCEQRTYRRGIWGSGGPAGDERGQAGEHSPGRIARNCPISKGNTYRDVVSVSNEVGCTGLTGIKMVQSTKEAPSFLFRVYSFWEPLAYP